MNGIKVFIIVLLVILLILYIHIGIATHELSKMLYCVKSGDCLWSIAEQYCPRNMDKREYLYMIAKHNELSSSTIQPGQILTIFVES